MANEIFTFNDNGDLKPELDRVSAFIRSRWSMPHYFCERISSRWSYITGAGTLYGPGVRINLTDTIGLLLQQDPPDTEEWLDFQQHLTAWLCQHAGVRSAKQP